MIGLKVTYGSPAGVKSVRPASPSVRFQLLRVGVTEFVTEDGFLVRIALKVKGVRRVPCELGGVPYEVDAVFVPTVQPALQANRSNFAQARMWMLN